MGVTFTALNAEFRSVGAAALLGEIGAIDKKVEISAAKMKDALARTGNDLQAATRLVLKEAAQTSAAVQGVGAAASQSFSGAAAAAEGMSVRSARATQGVARGLEMVARTGNLTGRSLDAVLSNVSGLALGFGTGGVLVGAIGIATASIVELFTRTRKELEKTQTEFNTRLGDMIKSGNLAGITGQYGSQTIAYSGDPTARIIGKNPGESEIDFIVRSQGIKGLQSKIAQLRASPSDVFDPMSGQKVGTGPNDQLETYLDRLTQLTATYERAKAAGEALTKTIVDLGESGRKKVDAPDKWPGGFSDLPEWMKRIRDNGTPLTPTGTSDRDQLKTLASAYAINAQITADVEKRTEYEKKLAEVLKQIDDLDGKNPHLKPSDPKAAKTIPLPGDAEFKAAGDRMKQLAAGVGQLFVDTLTSTITRGFQTMFTRGANFGSMFKSVTASLLEGIGDMMIRFGESTAAFAAFQLKILAALGGGNPALGLAASIALIAAGAALKGVGGALGSSGSGGGYGGGYGGGTSYSGTTVVGYVNPATSLAPHSAFSGVAPMTPVVVNATIIGKDDPSAQRQLMEMIARAQRRGSTSG